MPANKGIPERVFSDVMNGLFGNDEDESGTIQDIDITELYPFYNHPFKVQHDSDMEQLIESVKTNGVLVPVTVRKRKTGEGYELISGHRRRFAAESAGLDTIPAIIKDLSDDEAIIAMVDSNLQREEILPSEKAYAYKMKMEAMSHEGKRSEDSSTQVGWKSETASVIGEATGESKNTVRRYIRLTELIPELLELVDVKKLKLNAAVEISYIAKDDQETLNGFMKEYDVYPSIAQAQDIKVLSREGDFTKSNLAAMMLKTKKEKEPKVKKRNVTIKSDVLSKYFTEDVSKEEIETIICRLLDQHFKK